LKQIRLIELKLIVTGNTSQCYIFWDILTKDHGTGSLS